MVMKKYIDNALFFDLILSATLCFLIFLGRDSIQKVFSIPSTDNLNSLCVSLITVCATLIGFLLTIITVILTFKKGFTHDQLAKNDTEANGLENVSVFERKRTKTEQFYGSMMHAMVVKVFISSTFELVFILVILLLLQFNVIILPIGLSVLIHLGILFLLLFTMTRCLYIFRLFIKVHLPDSESSTS